MTKILSQFISQEPYIIWLSFRVHLCKMMIYPGVFFIFWKFWFFGLLVGWKNFPEFYFLGSLVGGKGKKSLKLTSNSVCCAPNLKNYTLYDHHLWYTSVNDNISRLFFHFLKILVFQVVRRVKRQKMAQKWQKLSFVTYVSGTIHHMILIYVTHV